MSKYSIPRIEGIATTLINDEPWTMRDIEQILIECRELKKEQKRIKKLTEALDNLRLAAHSVLEGARSSARTRDLAAATAEAEAALGVGK